ncbi:MAG: hypothetical protein SVM79_04135, partial [Chloroflexota bacterium]|nr:hypothetical protein [Chloroflexota bacterium]
PKVVLRQMIDYIKGNNLKPPAARAEWVKKATATQVPNTNTRGLTRGLQRNPIVLAEGAAVSQRQLPNGT